ncbi:MAG: hypothetical protein R2731_03675 [Nocardioides sp.]
MMTNSHRLPHGPAAALAQALDQLRERRLALAARAKWRAELESYTTEPEIDDLLAALDRYHGAEAEEMRSILHRNLMQARRLAG